MKILRAAFGYDVSVAVPASPGAVWTVIADYDRDASWREGVGMRCEPPGLVRDGTRTFEVLRAFGQEHEKVARIEAVEPGRSFRFRGEDGSFVGSRSVEDTSSGTRLRVTLEVRVTGLLALAAPVAGWLFRRRVARDLARLRALLARTANDGRSEGFVRS